MASPVGDSTAAPCGHDYDHRYLVHCTCDIVTSSVHVRHKYTTHQTGLCRERTNPPPRLGRSASDGGTVLTADRCPDCSSSRVDRTPPFPCYGRRGTREQDSRVTWTHMDRRLPSRWEEWPLTITISSRSRTVSLEISDTRCDVASSPTGRWLLN